MPKLDDKLIVVTGAFGVLGSAVAEAAEGAGARVARLDQASAAKPGPLVFGNLDLTDEADARRVMAEIAAEAGRIDGLVNIAGGFTWRTLKDGSTEVWDQMFRINLLTAVSASRAALDHLTAAKGAIVNIGANAAARAAAGMGAYAASKSGVLRLTESLAEELAGAGVRVNAVMPSIIDTPANRRDMPDADVKTWVLPRDIAAVILFLLSDEARAVTGAAIPVTNPRRSRAA
ncbi:MAG TPA: SDR family oxidoreductase [Caulobacteraceae bacterium]|nr:SDR family oxidoreductase [Caulobacteraceae bacterium]